MGAAFLLIMIFSFAPVIGFICWSQQRDWQSTYLRRDAHALTRH